MIALRIIFSSSMPETVALVSRARRQGAHPASWISRSSPYPSRSLINLQPGKKASLSIDRFAGKGVPSLIRIVATPSVYGI